MSFYHYYYYPFEMNYIDFHYYKFLSTVDKTLEQINHTIQDIVFYHYQI